MSVLLSTNTDRTVKFQATIAKVTTMADGSLRCIFDMPEDSVLPAAELMAMKLAGVVLHITCQPMPVDPKIERSNEPTMLNVNELCNADASIYTL
jgi:hypothetical protein